jgi:hypothetical protein
LTALLTEQPAAVTERSGRRFGFRTRAGAAVVGMALLLTGCAAGQRAQTSTETPVVDGIATQSGNIDIRDASIAAPTGNNYPAGSSATLTLVFINNGTSPDELTGVTTSAATKVVLYPNGTAAALAALSSTPSASAGDTPTSSTPTSSSPTSSAATTNTAIVLPPAEDVPVGLDTTQPAIQLEGLTQALFPAQPVVLTFTFQDAAPLTVTLAVHLTASAPNAPTLAVTHATSDE